MLPLLMLIATPDPETAIDAERAFNRAAQTEGQWTAFRKSSTDDAVIFTPQPARVHEALPKTDPKVTVQWWPAESYVSCDGSMAVNTGPWVRPKAVGYFTTVWVRQSDGHYKWEYDGGDTLAAPRALPEKPRVRTASCAGHPRPFHIIPPPAGVTQHVGQSKDGTLTYIWVVKADGSRAFAVSLWNGEDWDPNVLTNDIAAPK